jgi:2,3-bisphosphoglycerate-independent phosphoglycerate mutase
MSELKTKILCIWDGFGLASKSANNIPSLIEMKNFKPLLAKYPWTTLDANGDSVGQESGLVGNSEVGHMNLGGLKLVPQLSYQITQSAETGFKLNHHVSPDQNFDPNEFLKQVFHGQKQKTIHLIGLFSLGTIHSDLRHWVGAINSAGSAGAHKIVLHIVSDGRDSDPKSLLKTWGYFVDKYGGQFQKFQDKIFLGSVGGRFYAMDRDKNWDRVAKGLLSMFLTHTVVSKFGHEKLSTFLEKHYLLLKNREINLWGQTYHLTDFINKEFVNDNLKSIQIYLDYVADLNYSRKEFDEIINPTKTSYLSPDPLRNKENGIEEGHAVWLLNFRTDRFKQFAQMLCEINREFDLNLTILSMNDYGVENLPALDWNPDDQIVSTGYYAVFKNKPVENTLADYIEKQGKTQLHIAETEKYNHVTYFLNGGQNKRHKDEDWVVIDSNKVSSHGQKPEMKAVEITDYILEKGLEKYDYIIVNYANPDMIGHTGDIEASKTSMQILDEQLGRLVEAVELGGHSLILTADHGNIEKVGKYESQGQSLTDTEHNSSPVPCILVSKNLNTKNLAEKLFKLDVNVELITNSLLLADNQVELKLDEWLNDKQIPNPSLPLWVAGALLASLN